MSPRSSAQSNALSALDDVHTRPPFLPQWALIAAAEFIYVIGITRSVVPRTDSSSSQQSKRSVGFAMSAIEHPAAIFGSNTFWSGDVRMSAVSAIKWTPQKMIHLASFAAAAIFESLYESPVKSAYSITSSRW